MVWGRLTIPSPSWLPSTITIIFINSHARSHYGLGTIIIIILWEDWEKHYQFQEPCLQNHLKVLELDKHGSKSQQFFVNCELLSIVSWSRKWCNLKFVWKWKRCHIRMWQQWFVFARDWSADWSSEFISNFLHGLGISGGGGGDHLELEPRIFATLHFTKESSCLLQILHHQVLRRFPVFLYICPKNEKNEIAKFALNFHFVHRSKRKERTANLFCKTSTSIITIITIILITLTNIIIILILITILIIA